MVLVVIMILISGTLGYYMLKLNNKMDNFTHDMYKLKLYDKTIRELTRRTGLYIDNDIVMIYVRDRTPEQITQTFYHEVAGHHNISLSEHSYTTNDFIAMDKAHFCDHVKQTQFSFEHDSETNIK